MFDIVLKQCLDSFFFIDSCRCKGGGGRPKSLTLQVPSPRLPPPLNSCRCGGGRGRRKSACRYCPQPQQKPKQHFPNVQKAIQRHAETVHSRSNSQNKTSKTFRQPHRDMQRPVHSRSNNQNNTSKTCRMKYTRNPNKGPPHTQTGTEEANGNSLAEP